MGTRQYAPSQDVRLPSLSAGDRNGLTTHAWPASARPLSDIRELTEPSLLDVMVKIQTGEVRSQTQSNHTSIVRRGPSVRRQGSLRILEPSADSGYRNDTESSETTSESQISVHDASSIYSIPMSSIPPRGSSQNREPNRSIIAPGLRASPTRGKSVRSRTIPNHGKSRSPVKEVGILLDAVSSDGSRRIPSRTFIRTPSPRDILEFPSYRHPRVSIDLQVLAPLFVGGGSIEGQVRIMVDDAEDKIKQKKRMAIGRIAVDLVGSEEASGTRKSIFLSLGTELIDPTHPPPRNMIIPDAQKSGSESFWTLKPSLTNIPFMLSLPLDTGPPPFQSKHARIRYILCVTLLVRDSDRRFLIRSSQDVSVLSTYDPEKALRSLPSPLTACDEWTTHKSGTMESVKITAGLHRQVWVSGSSIFVDVHISNKSRKVIKKIDLSLERDILCYRHAAAATREQSASQARIFESNERTIYSKSCIKQGVQGWNGVDGYSSAVRTCDLDIPRGHATVKCGKYFEVRYFLNIFASTSHTKVVSVQLPIILIHMNSLDVVPNSVAQVAAAIEEKRSNHSRGRPRTGMNTSLKSNTRGSLPFQTTPSPGRASSKLERRPSKIQGRAFAAPRQQSVERMRAEADALRHLAAVIDSSPQKHLPSTRRDGSAFTTNKDRKRHAGNGNTMIISRPAREIHKQPSNLSIGGISVGSYTIFHDSSSSSVGMEYITPPSKRKGRIFDPSMLGRSEDDGGDDDDNKTNNNDIQTVGLKDRIRHLHSIRSTGSMGSHRSTGTTRSRWHDRFGGNNKENVPTAGAAHSALGYHHQQPHQRQRQYNKGIASTMGAHALGLASHIHVSQQPEDHFFSPERPERDGVVGIARAPSWRTKDDVDIDSRRFEFKAIKRKGSHGGGGGLLKEWLEGIKGGFGGVGPRKGEREGVSSGRGNWI